MIVMSLSVVKIQARLLISSHCNEKGNSDNHIRLSFSITIVWTLFE